MLLLTVLAFFLGFFFVIAVQALILRMLCLRITGGKRPAFGRACGIVLTVYLVGIMLSVPVVILGMAANISFTQIQFLVTLAHFITASILYGDNIANAISGRPIGPLKGGLVALILYVLPTITILLTARVLS